MCGIFGIYQRGGDNTAAELTALGLFALQHRGQESVGIAVSDGEQVRIHKAMGLVSSLLHQDIAARLPGHVGIGHVRYSTHGSSDLANAQPLLAVTGSGPVAMAHNGNLTNTRPLRENLFGQGTAFYTTTDSELILHLIAAQAAKPLEEAVQKAVAGLSGSFSLVIMNERKLIGLRDAHGNRPLLLGKAEDSFILASESCAIAALNAEVVREIEPGEMVVVEGSRVTSRRILSHPRRAFCIFEYIYLARPDSELAQVSMHEVRKRIGGELAREHPIEADIVIPVPNSAKSAALGYAEVAGIAFEIGLVTNDYVGRTFISPTQSLRQLGVQIKLNAIPQVLAGKRVILVDDSLVRGTTSKKAIAMLRKAGAREVHLAIAAPPFLYPCYYGIDVPETDQLIASNRTLSEIRELIGADSLHHISLEGLYKAVGAERSTMCDACFSGEFFTPVDEEDPWNFTGGRKEANGDYAGSNRL
ncbi:MAG TPA: amidophosphoribosyltransferase [Firmicutes bacterium]|nr:amidophosphoribosyltransferase [Bacillota bacterium]